MFSVSLSIHRSQSYRMFGLSPPLSLFFFGSVWVVGHFTVSLYLPGLFLVGSFGTVSSRSVNVRRFRVSSGLLLDEIALLPLFH